MTIDMLELIVSKKFAAAESVCVLELEAVDGGTLPYFDAGAHIEVHLRPGLIRQYSLCNPPSECGCYRIAVLRTTDSRGGSSAVHEQLQVGQRLRASEPRNLFALQPQARHSVLIAGGIGITPLLSMAYHLAANGQSFELHYFSRSEADAAFVQELSTSAFAHRVCFHFSHDVAANQQVMRQVLASHSPTHALYVCGPAGFIDATLAAAAGVGWKSSQLYHELFAPSVPSVATSDGSFEVEIGSTGQVHVIPPNRSICQVLEDAGIDLLVSCERGICGTCAIPLLAGEAEHRDQVLSDEERTEQRLFTPCCSRARTTRLVLDI